MGPLAKGGLEAPPGGQVGGVAVAKMPFAHLGHKNTLTVGLAGPHPSNCPTNPHAPTLLDTFKTKLQPKIHICKEIIK